MTGNGRGGRRPGAGRPKGTTKPVHLQRKQRQVRAFDEEWPVIQEFVKVLRIVGAERAREAIKRLSVKETE